MVGANCQLDKIWNHLKTGFNIPLGDCLDCVNGEGKLSHCGKTSQIGILHCRERRPEGKQAFTALFLG